MRKVGRPKIIRGDISCPSCGSNHIVKDGKLKGRQRMKCMNCRYHFLPDAKHSHPKWKRKLAIKMYTNGMSMRAISRTLNIPLGTIFTWIKRYGNATRAQEEVGGS